MDVVIVTLLRESLRYTLDSINKTIPDPNVIMITDKGVIGDLRNKGLQKCSSKYCCFVDDDIVLNKNWFSKCMTKLETTPNVVAVVGRTEEGYTLGCMICKTEEFKRRGGFPRLDSYISNKYGSSFVILEDAVCEHRVGRGIVVIGHVFHFLTHGFQTETRAGIYNNPVASVRLMFQYLKKRLPEYAVVQMFWLFKIVFVWPFILEDAKEKKK